MLESHLLNGFTGKCTSIRRLKIRNRYTNKVQACSPAQGGGFADTIWSAEAQLVRWHPWGVSRYVLGEGLEKRSSDLAAEVAEQREAFEQAAAEKAAAAAAAPAAVEEAKPADAEAKPLVEVGCRLEGRHILTVELWAQ